MELIHHWSSEGIEVGVSKDKDLFVNGTQVKLEPQESKYLACLAAKQGKICTAKMLLESLYVDREEAPEFILFTVFASKIRKKLRLAQAGAENVIKTAWGRGFAFGDTQTSAVPPQSSLLSSIFERPPTRWIASRKEQIVQAVGDGSLTLTEVQASLPDLSQEEFEEWCMMHHKHGKHGLRITKHYSDFMSG